MNRHEQRVIAMQSVYQHLLLGKDIRKCVFDVMKGSNDIDGYLYSLTMGTVENKEAFEQKINELLRDDWDFDRLSMLEQAILLISFQEILANDTPKAVVINEAITLAKKYCDDNSYNKPSAIKKVVDANPGSLVMFIEYDSLEYAKKYKTKAVKKTLSIPEWLNDLALKQNINFSSVLQEALINKLEDDNCEH